MVSIKRNMGLLFINFMMFVCFMGLYTISNAVGCTNGQVECCKGTILACCPHPGYQNGKELSYDLSACSTFTPILPDDPIIIKPIAECTSGQTQYKPSGSCGTSSRSCCSNGTWSDWDSKCDASTSCGTTQCWNGLTCASKGPVSKTCSGNVANAKSGTLTRTATCGSSGWSYGSWTGTCTCNTGYTWNSSSKICEAKTCSGSDFYNASSNQCCSVGSYMVKSGTNGQTMWASCASNSLDVTGACCTMSNNAEFQLPSSAGSCSAFASKAGLSLGRFHIDHACARL